MEAKKYSIWDYIGGVLVLFITGVTFLQVLSRYVFKLSLSWPDELSRYLFVWLVMLASVAALIRGGHFVLGLTTRLSPNGIAKILIDTVMDVIMCIFLAVLGYYGGKLAYMVRNQLSPAMQISVSYFYSAIPVGSGLMLIYTAFRMIKRVVGYSRRGGAAK